MFKPTFALPRYMYSVNHLDFVTKYALFQTELDRNRFNSNMFDMLCEIGNDSRFEERLLVHYFTTNRKAFKLDNQFASAKNASKAAAKQAQLNHYFTT